MTLARAALVATLVIGPVWPVSVEAQRSAAPAPRRPSSTGAAAAAPEAPAPGASSGAVASPGPVTSTAPIAGATPGDYVIGVEDVLGVQFWRDDQMSGDVVVRPDGKITLRLVNDVVAAGLTTDQLRERLEKEASKFLAEPQATIIVKQINSRRVFTIGEIGKQGPLPMISPLTISQLISVAGGLTEYAQKENIFVKRMEGDKVVTIRFDYSAFMRGRNLEQDILLRPGDTLVVPGG